ncbi:MAG: Gfo/Idh/MocA family oxidoreductase [Bacteroidota bacterium]
MKVLVIGAGLIGLEYMRILNDLNVQFESVCRSKERAQRVKEETGIDIISGGVEQMGERLHKFSHFIVATDVESSFEITSFLLKNKCSHLLLEKPGTSSIDQFLKLYLDYSDSFSNVFLAYNRRNYSSVLKAKELAESDGGVLSCHFDFTEWTHVIEAMNKPKFQLKNWFFGNSTHVIDTAFFIIGKPQKLNPISIGELSWHKPSIFVGSGITKNNVVFSYHSNWQSAGRWSIEVKTRNRALRLMPMEQLFEQKIGTLTWEPIEINNEKDISYKPGFYKQVVEFLFEPNPNLKAFKEQYEDLEIYSEIVGTVE